MLFRKLRIESTPDSKEPVERWYMIVRTIEDVLAYTKINASLFYDALKALPDSITKSHLDGARERLLHMTFSAQIEIHGKKNIDVLGAMDKLVADKARNMIKHVLNGDYILIQQHGGYCSYKGFMETWNPKITDEVEKENCYFPSDTQVIETDLLFIENGERVPVQFERDVMGLVGINFNNDTIINSERFKRYNSSAPTGKIVYKLALLKLRDPEFTAKMIVKAKSVAVETHLADVAQFDKMMGLFASLSDKTIYIKTDYRDQLTSHALYNTCNDKHKIIFVS